VALVGRVENRSGWLRLSAPAELLIVCSPGASASRYQLLKAEVKRDWREFRAEAALHDDRLLGLGAPSGQSLVFERDKTFDLGVRLILTSLQKGEYGLVPPGVIVGGKVLPAGRIYTFSLE
jgi:hypothetical protein